MLRLICHDLDSARRVGAVALDSKWYAKRGDIPTLTVSRSEVQEQPAALRGEAEVAFEAWDGAKWVEPPGGRFVMADDSWDRTGDGSKTHALQLVGWVGRLRFATLAKGTATLDEDGKRAFLSSTPGAIMISFLQEAKARGWAPSFTWDFSAEKDSAGKAWPMVATRRYDLGTTAWDALSNLYESGLVDFRTEGRTLRMWPAEGATVDHTTKAAPVYLRDASIGSSPEKTDYSQQVTHVTVYGDEGAQWTFTNGNAGVLDRRERTIQAGGVRDEATARQYAEPHLAGGLNPSQQYTREWTVGTPGLPWLPGVDVQPGDWVYADTIEGPKQRMRVADVSLRSRGSSPAVAFVTLGSVQDDILSRLAKRQKGIEGGAGMVASGKPTQPQREGERPPAAPTKPLVTSTAYYDQQGTLASSVTASWEPVTAAVDGSAITVTSYRMYVQRVGFSGWQVVSTDKASATMPGLIPGDAYDVRVSAISQNNKEGAASPATRINAATDAVPPLVPNPPALTSDVGFVVVATDHKGAGGTTQPADYAGVVVFVGGKETGRIPAGLASWSFKGTPGQQYAVTLASYDVVGNVSARSAEVAIVCKSAVEESTIAKALADTAKAVDQAKSDAAVATGKASAASTAATDAFNRAVAAMDKAIASAQAGANLILNGGFEQVDAAGDVVEWPKPTAAFGWATTGQRSGVRGLRMGPVSSNTLTPLGASLWQVSPGRSIYIEAWVTRIGAEPKSGNAVALAASYRRADGAIVAGGTLGATPMSALSEGEPTRISAIFVVPDGAAAMGVRLQTYGPTTNTYVFDDLLAVDVTEAVAAQKAAADAAAKAATASDAASQAINSANGKNSVTRSTAAPSGSGATAGDTWWQVDSYAASNTIGQWVWDGSKWVSTKIRDEMIANLDVNKLTVSGSSHLSDVVASRLIADFGSFGLLNAKTVLIGDTSNLIRGGDMLDLDLSHNWDAPPASMTSGTDAGGPFIRIAGAATVYNLAITPARIPDEIAVDVLVQGTGGAGSFAVAVMARKADGTQAAYEYVIGPVTGFLDLQTLTGTVKARADWASVQFVVIASNATYTIRSLSARKRATGRLIVDGAITAGKLAARAVEADAIAAGAVTAMAIATDALDFKTATGFQLTSPTIKTSTTANRGIVLSGNQMLGYNAAGQQRFLLDGNTGSVALGGGTFVVDGTTGNLTMRGILRTGNYPAYPYTEVNDGLWSNMTGVRFGTEPTYVQQAEIRASKVPFDAYGRRWSPATIWLQSGYLNTNPAPNASAFVTDGTIFMSTATQGTRAAEMTLDAQGWIRMRVTGGHSIAVQGIPQQTTSMPLYVDSNWNLFYGGSQACLKLDREPISLDAARAMLDVTPQTWRDRGEVERDPDTTRRWPGFVVEDVEAASAKHGGALDELITDPPEGSDGYRGIAYDRVPAYLLALIKDHEDRLTQIGA